MNYFREILLERMGGKCVKCNSTDELEFDHIDPSKKSFNISSGYHKPKEEMENELLKCQLLCNKCHLEKTKKNREFIPKTIAGGRPQKYKNLGPTERMRVPLYKQITILCDVLDRKAEEGCDAVELLDSFIEDISSR
jgi:hypothetical protein